MKTNKQEEDRLPRPGRALGEYLGRHKMTLAEYDKINHTFFGIPDEEWQEMAAQSRKLSGYPDPATLTPTDRTAPVEGQTDEKDT